MPTALFGLAFLVWAYSVFLGILSLRDGRYRSGLYVIPTFLALAAGWMGSMNWQLFVVVACLDIGCLFLFGKLLADHTAGTGRKRR